MCFTETGRRDPHRGTEKNFARPRNTGAGAGKPARSANSGKRNDSGGSKAASADRQRQPPARRDAATATSRCGGYQIEAEEVSKPIGREMKTRIRYASRWTRLAADHTCDCAAPRQFPSHGRPAPFATLAGIGRTGLSCVKCIRCIERAPSARCRHPRGRTPAITETMNILPGATPNSAHETGVLEAYSPYRGMTTAGRACLAAIARSQPPSNQTKQADRPDSVTAGRPAMTAIPLGRGLLPGSSFLPARSASHIIACLFGIAPGGGCRVSPFVAGSACALPGRQRLVSVALFLALYRSRSLRFSADGR